MIESHQVVSLLQGDESLVDSTLVRVEVISLLGVPTISLEFEARKSSKFKQVILVFKEVIAFELQFVEGNSFLDVWDLKFLKMEGEEFYISLDPDPETLPAAGVTKIEPAETDGFFVRARRIELFAT